MTAACLLDVVLAILKVINNRECNDNNSRDFTLIRDSIGPSKDEVTSCNSLGDRIRRHLGL